MSDTDPVLARFQRLPIQMQRAVESALLGTGPIAAGSTLDRVQRARFESLVAAAEAELAAQAPAPTPTSRVVARSASPSSPWFPSTAPRTATPPAAAPRAAAPGLPEDVDEALDQALDHVTLAERIGAPPATCAAILNGYLCDLWRRPSVRERFDRFEVLESWVGFLRQRGKH